MNIKNRKGFTLVEILAVIVLLGILIATAIGAYSAMLDKNKKDSMELEKKMLIDTGKYYYKQLGKKSNYAAYVDENKVRHSCISVKTLIDKGYYKGDVKFLNEKLTRDNAVIKIKEKHGKTDYELVYNYKKDQDCVYYNITNQLSENTKVSMSNKDGGTDIYLDTSIVNDGNSNYILKILFGADTYDKVINYSIPVYVLEVLDTSGSMSGSKYTNAKNASLSLANNMIDRIEDSHIGLINFSTNAQLKRDFATSKLTNSNFNYASGTTNILDALNLAYNTMKKVKPDKNGVEPIKYVVFLSDGAPVASYSDHRCDYYNAQCAKALEEYAKRITGDLNSNFVVIGYNMYQDIYRTIASVDDTGKICPASDYTKNGKKYCYYNSTSSNIANLFNNISNSIEETVRSQSISESVINIKFDDAIKIVDVEGNEVKDLKLNINLNDYMTDNIRKEYQYLMNIENIDDTKFKCDYEKKDCVYAAKLFQKYYLDLYDMDKRFVKKIEPDTYPEITIHKTLESYIN